MALTLKYRPTNLDDIVGQEHLLGKNRPFRILVEKDALLHSFFYGVSGCGKTTLARVVAKKLNRPFFELNATTLKVDDLRKIFKTYSMALEKPIIFIDEVHRLSRNQEEVLLPFMETHQALILGASTQNPYHSLSLAIRSRSHLFELKPINKKELNRYLKRVLIGENIELDKEIKDFIVSSSGGDGRAMLNLLETAISLKDNLTLTNLKSIRPHAMQQGSSEDDNHYNLTSAMIKSIRGSNIDAGLYYLARLISGAEPPEFIARRLAILASEDIGNANPNALNLSASTLTIVKNIGYPEARIPLAQLVVYLSSSPKSNSSYKAINSAMKAIEDGDIYPIPSSIINCHQNYLNPHNFGGWVSQEYISSSVKFYNSSNIGFEKKLNEWITKIKCL